MTKKRSLTLGPKREAFKAMAAAYKDVSDEVRQNEDFNKELVKAGIKVRYSRKRVSSR